MSRQHVHAEIAPNRVTQSDLEALGGILNVLIADLFLIYYKTKNVQCHLSGASLWDYGLLLEAQSSEIIACMDAILERLRNLRLQTLHPLEEVAQRRINRGRAIKVIDSTITLQGLLFDNYNLIKLLEIVGIIAERQDDSITSALIDRCSLDAERHVWALLKAL